MITNHWLKETFKTLKIILISILFFRYPIVKNESTIHQKAIKLYKAITFDNLTSFLIIRKETRYNNKNINSYNTE